MTTILRADENLRVLNLFFVSIVMAPEHVADRQNIDEVVGNNTHDAIRERSPLLLFVVSNDVKSFQQELDNEGRAKENELLYDFFDFFVKVSELAHFSQRLHQPDHGQKVEDGDKHVGRDVDVADCKRAILPRDESWYKPYDQQLQAHESPCDDVDN